MKSNDKKLEDTEIFGKYRVAIHVYIGKHLVSKFLTWILTLPVSGNGRFCQSRNKEHIERQK